MPSSSTRIWFTLSSKPAPNTFNSHGPLLTFDGNECLRRHTPSVASVDRRVRSANWQALTIIQYFQLGHVNNNNTIMRKDIRVGRLSRNPISPCWFNLSMYTTSWLLSASRPISQIMLGQFNLHSLSALSTLPKELQLVNILLTTTTILLDSNHLASKEWQNWMPLANIRSADSVKPLRLPDWLIHPTILISFAKWWQALWSKRRVRTYMHVYVKDVCTSASR